MAIFDWTLQTLSRSDGRSAVAAAAYRAGAYLRDDRTSLAHDFSRRRGIQSEIVLPAGVSAPEPTVPTWRHELRSRLWNEAERAERRCNSVVAREIVIALPHELDEAQRAALGRGYARWLADRYRVAVDTAWHPPSASGDQRNDHMHLQFTTREVGDGFSFGAKTRILDSAATGGPEIAIMRAEWAAMANAALKAAGRDEWVDHRSLADRGVDREPGRHLGPMRTNMIRAATKRVAALDAEIAELQAEIATLKAEERRDREQLHPPPLAMVVIDQRTLGPLGPYMATPPVSPAVDSAPVPPAAAPEIAEAPPAPPRKRRLARPALEPDPISVEARPLAIVPSPGSQASRPGLSAAALEAAVAAAAMAEVERQNRVHAAALAAETRAAEEEEGAKRKKVLQPALERPAGPPASPKKVLFSSKRPDGRPRLPPVVMPGPEPSDGGSPKKGAKAVLRPVTFAGSPKKTRSPATGKTRGRTKGRGDRGR